MTDPACHTLSGYLPPVRDFFDGQYAAHDRYWWRGPNWYSTDPADHTAFNAAWLAAAARRGQGRALDLGAGEGADAIRLAKLGYAIDAVEVFSTATPVPVEHSIIPVFPDEEGGTVERFYWD